MKQTTTPKLSAPDARQTCGFVQWFGMSVQLKKIAAVLAVVGIAGSASAANKFWAGPSATTNSPVSGAWDTTSTVWNNGTGNTANSTFATGDAAIFGGADGSYGIMCSTLSAATLTFGNSGYTLTNGTAVTVTTTTGNNGVNVASGKTATIGANVTLSITGNGGFINNGTTFGGQLIIANGGTITQPNPYAFSIDGASGSMLRVLTGGIASHTGAGSGVRIGASANTSATLSIEGGAFNNTGSATFAIGNAAGSTGVVSVVSGTLNVPNTPILLGNNATATATNNLNGGTEISRQVKLGASGAVSIFNFNGGTLKGVNPGIASLTNAFMVGLTAANVRNNGGIIDYNGTPITIGQALVHSTISGDSATDGGLIVTNSLVGGSLTLSNANTYNGSTVVKGGAKLVTTTLSTGASAYSVADGGTLEVQVAAAGQSLTNSSLTLGTAGNVTNNFTLNANASTAIPAVTVNGALNLNGTVNVNVTGSGLTGPNTYLLMSYGSITGSGSFVVGSVPTVAGYLVILTNDTSANQLKLVYAQSPQAVKWAAGNGNWDTTSLNWNLLSGTGPTNYIEGASVAFDDSATGTSPITVTLTGARSPSVVSNNAAKTYILAGSSGISGGALLTKNGSGTFVLDNSAANSFSTIAINSGAVQLGNNDAGGDLGSGSITNNATLAFNRTDSATVANLISGPGAIAQNGSGTVTLTGASTLTGISTINNGQLILGNSAALQSSTVSNNLPNGLAFASGITTATLGGLAGTGDISMLNAASSLVAITVGGNNQPTAYSGNFSGGANLLKTGTNLLALSGNSSTLGSIQVTAAGTLALTNATISMANLQLVTDNATLLINGGNISVSSDSRIQGANGVYNIGGNATVYLPKLVIGSAAAANTNNLVTVSGTAQIYQNQTGGSQNPVDALWIGGNNSGSGGLLLKDSAYWNNGSSAANIVVVGNNGTGQGSLTIQDNASFYNGTVIRVADLVGNVGTVNLNGGVCSVNGFSKGAGLGTINVNGGGIQALTATANFFLGFTNTSGTNAVNLISGKLTFDNNGNAVTINNVLSGAGGLISQGSGTLTLPLANTYTGNTVINAGTLILTNAGSINSSSSISNNAGATLDVSGAATQLSIAGALMFNNSTLIANLATTNLTVGTIGTVGAASTINLTALPTINSLPASVRVIKYTTAAPGLVDGGNNLTALGVTLPATSSPLGYLTNNTAAKSIDLVITSMVLVPVIVSQPAPDSAYPGYKAHFSVALQLTNSAGLAYNWRKNGVPLADGSNLVGTATATMHISSASTNDAANYDVIITNISGSITSSPALLTILSPTNYEAAAVAAGPSALYMMQETNDPSTGTAIAFDYAGDLDGVYGVSAQNGFNGITGPTSSSGFPGFSSTTTALQSQGFVTNSQVTIPPLNLNTNTVTLTAWINPSTPAAFSGIVFCRNGSTVAGLNISGGTDINGHPALGYTWNNEAGTYGWNSQIAPPSGVWSYVALVITPTNATVYIFNTNGLLSASNPYTHVVQSFSGNTLVGADNISTGNREFNGSLYGAAIYASALTQRQLETIYGAASGVSNFPPVIVSQPVSQSLYAQQTATISAPASGTQPLSYQWMTFDGVGAYANIANGGRISGATSASLVISNLALADATNFVLVVTNNFGVVTSSVATLTVNPVGPAENITNSTVEAAGSDWNTGSAWSDGLAASLSAVSKPGSIYFIVPAAGLRTPNVGSIAQFPGNLLNVLGDGGFNSSPATATLGALILKGTGSAYTKLVMNGGEILSFTDNNGNHIIGGTEMNVLANTPIAGLSSTGGRSIIINATLTGSGTMDYIGWANATFQTTAATALNIAGTNNTFNGTWNVEAGTLVGSTPGALGTNIITVGTNAALQTTYPLNNTNGTLILNGRMNLTQNDVFQNVIINGATLNGGTYPYATLAASYPANFPAVWTGVTGADTLTSAAGSITVLAATIPTNSPPIGFSFSGNTLSLTWPGTYQGWIAQSNSVNLANTNYWFDIAGSQAATNLTVTLNPALTNVFYRLRHP